MRNFLIILLSSSILILGITTTSAIATEVTPLGEKFTASGTATLEIEFFKLMKIPFTCDSSFSGTIPVAPDNPIHEGSVIMTISPPVFTKCSFKSSITTTATDGAWTLSVNDEPIRFLGTITIPRSGIIFNPGELSESCIITAPWAQYTPITALWHEFGNLMEFKYQEIPIEGVGTCYEPGPVAYFSAEFKLFTAKGESVAVK